MDRRFGTASLLGACFLVGAVLLAACEAPRPPQESSPVSSGEDRRGSHAGDERRPHELRIGAIFSLPSDGEPGDRQPWLGAALALETINNGGGALLADGSRRPLRLVVHDDDGLADRTPLAMRDLIEEAGVLAVVAASSRGSALRAAELAEGAGIPLVTLVDPDAGGLVRSRRWTFSLALDTDQAVSAVAAFLSGRRAERIGWLAPATATGSIARAALARQAIGAGLPIVAEESYGPGEADLDEPIGRLLSAGAEQIVAWPRDARDAAAVARAAGTRMPRQRLYLGPPAATDAFLVLGGEAAVGARVVAPRLTLADDLWDHDPATPVARDFIRAFRLRHGEQPSPAAAAGWDVVRLLVEAVERSAPTRPALRDALEATSSFSGANGTIRFDASDHTGLDSRAFMVARVVSGGWRLPP